MFEVIYREAVIVRRRVDLILPLLPLFNDCLDSLCLELSTMSLSPMTLPEEGNLTSSCVALIALVISPDPHMTISVR